MADHLGVTEACFNRDIVECKVMSNEAVVDELYGFNRDIVECKV